MVTGMFGFGVGSEHGVVVAAVGGVGVTASEKTSLDQCVLEHGKHLQLVFRLQSEYLLDHLLWTYGPTHHRPITIDILPGMLARPGKGEAEVMAML